MRQTDTTRETLTRSDASNTNDASSVAHALRNKLTAIAGDAAVIAELTKSASFDPKDVAAIARDLARVSDEAIELVRRLLARPGSVQALGLGSAQVSSEVTTRDA